MRRLLIKRMIIVKNKKWRGISLILVMLLVLVSACVQQTVVEDVAPVPEEVPAPTEEVDVPVVEEVLPEEVPEVVAPEEVVEDVVEGVETTPEKTQTEEDKPFWQSETTRQLNNLTSIATAAQSAYQKSGLVRGWISDNGRLYGYYEKAYINTDNLVSDGYLESGLSASDYRILYVCGSDLMDFSGISVPNDQLGMQIFAATLVGDEYLVASASGKVGYISKNQYIELISKYSDSHGTVSRLSSAAAEYTRIMNFISLYDGGFEDYAVREVWKDDKYAMVVFSSKEDLTDIKQYILRNDANFWEVVYADVQVQLYPIPMVNQALPDLNLELLPDYNLASWRGKIVEEHNGALAALFAERAIASSSEITYMCGVTSCAYAIVEDGSRYAIYIKNGNWVAEYASSDYDAKNILQNATGMDLGFVILDD